MKSCKLGSVAQLVEQFALNEKVVSSILTGPTKMFYVYFLFLNDRTVYKGITCDLKRRINEHKLGKVASTKNKRPLKLVHYEAYLLKSDAKRREKYLKTTYGRRDIKRQLSSLLKQLRLK